MAEQLSRKALYDRVWSQPIKTLAARFGISDVALKKTCERAAVPTPDRGYWAKKEAGKGSFQVPLPVRSPGMDDEVVIAGPAGLRLQRVRVIAIRTAYSMRRTRLRISCHRFQRTRKRSAAASQPRHRQWSDNRRIDVLSQFVDRIIS